MSSLAIGPPRASHSFVSRAQSELSRERVREGVRAQPRARLRQSSAESESEGSRLREGSRERADTRAVRTQKPASVSASVSVSHRVLFGIDIGIGVGVGISSLSHRYRYRYFIGVSSLSVPGSRLALAAESQSWREVVRTHAGQAPLRKLRGSAGRRRSTRAERLPRTAASISHIDRMQLPSQHG